MRVNHANTIAVGDILSHHIIKKRAFTGAGFADNVGVLAAVFALGAKKTLGVPKISPPEINYVFIRIYAQYS